MSTKGEPGLRRRSGRLGGVMAAAGLLAVCLLIAGCEDADLTVDLHEPGVYKGPQDPLLDAGASPEFESRLRDRFSAVQTDR